MRPLPFLCAGLLVFQGVLGNVWGQDRRGSFIQPPRSVRSRDLDQRHIRLDLRVDWEQQTVHGRAELTVVPFRPLSTLTLDAAEMNIRSVRFAGQTDLPAATSAGRPLTYQTRDQILEIRLEHELPADAPVTLAIDYTITKPRHGVHFVVPDASEPRQPRMMWTQSEPEFAHYWFPCLDSPADRMTSEIRATVPEGNVTLSNGTLKSKSAHPDGSQTWHWVQEQSHVPYLMSLVVGDFEELRQDWNGTPVLSYVARGRLADAPRSFGQTPEMVGLFSRQVGWKYPWPKYAQICVDEYLWGGMEHTSATTLTDRTLHDERASLDVSSENLVAHELAHQWFGDLLTCKDWGELWLNESFATYFATLWQEHDEGIDEATWTRSREALRYLEEDRKYRRPIVTYQYPAPGAMFDAHSYPKGGRVLHMLRGVLGEDLFWKSIRHYVATHQHRTVETADLRRAIEEATGQGLNWFFDQWLYRGGHPELNVTWGWDAESRMARVTIQQTQKVDELTPLFRFPLEVELASRDQSQIRRVEVSRAEETFHFSCEQRPTRVCIDPRDWLLKTLRFPQSKEELLDQLAQDTHLMPRVQAAAALAERVADQDVRAALRWAARRDSFWGVREEAVKSLALHSSDDVRETLQEVATSDSKSFVRRAALGGLGKFPHPTTSATLRRAIAADRSYYAVAEALRALVKVDRAGAAADLLAAAEQPSHQEVILKAVGDGLVELKSTTAEARLEELLSRQPPPERRAVLIGILARLQPQRPETRQRLLNELQNKRIAVRQVALDALVALGDPSAITPLLERRRQEESPSMIRAVDAAIEKLRNAERSWDSLQKELRELRDKNQILEQRIGTLEAAGR